MSTNIHFDAYKNEFKETTGKDWNENLSDYIAFLQLKVQEAQLVALNELCSKIGNFIR